LIKPSGIVITNIAYALCVLFIAFAEGIINPFIPWNLVPVVIGYFLTRRAMVGTVPGQNAAWPAAGYNAAGVGTVIFFHMAWLFDWGGMATGSSTSALIFIFLPAYALIAGAVGFLVGALCRKIYIRAVKK
jgi:hypothetical protein